MSRHLMVLHITTYRQSFLGLRGKVREYLQSSLLRKALRYEEQVIAELPSAKLVMMVVIIALIVESS